MTVKQGSTNVVFRVHKDGDVVALFPNVEYRWPLCACYAHIGQHSGADYEHVIAQTKPATPEQYAALQRELESAPFEYVLNVCTRKPSQERRTQRKQVTQSASPIDAELTSKLHEIWQQVGHDIVPCVNTNEEAVDALVDRAYDMLTTAQRETLVRTPLSVLCKHFTLV